MKFCLRSRPSTHHVHAWHCTTTTIGHQLCQHITHLRILPPCPTTTALMIYCPGNQVSVCVTRFVIAIPTTSLMWMKSSPTTAWALPLPLLRALSRRMQQRRIRAAPLTQMVYLTSASVTRSPTFPWWTRKKLRLNSPRDRESGYGWQHKTQTVTGHNQPSYCCW